MAGDPVQQQRSVSDSRDRAASRPTYGFDYAAARMERQEHSIGPDWHLYFGRAVGVHSGASVPAGTRAPWFVPVARIGVWTPSTTCSRRTSRRSRRDRPGSCSSSSMTRWDRLDCALSFTEQRTRAQGPGESHRQGKGPDSGFTVAMSLLNACQGGSPARERAARASRRRRCCVRLPCWRRRRLPASISGERCLAMAAARRAGWACAPPAVVAAAGGFTSWRSPASLRPCTVSISATTTSPGRWSSSRINSCAGGWPMPHSTISCRR